MSRTAIVGTVTWPDGGAVASLRDDFTWDVPDDDDLERLLDAMTAGDVSGPADGAFGSKILARVAHAVGGEYRLARDEVADDQSGEIIVH